MFDVVYWLDVVTIIAAFCQLIVTAWVWFKVDNVEDDIDEIQDDIEDMSDTGM